jgi:hypothetical protein
MYLAVIVSLELCGAVSNRKYNIKLLSIMLFLPFLKSLYFNVRMFLWAFPTGFCLQLKSLSRNFDLLLGVCETIGFTVRNTL